jgi:hypothetical protein
MPFTWRFPDAQLERSFGSKRGGKSFSTADAEICWNLTIPVIVKMLLTSPATLSYYIERLVITCGTTTLMGCGDVPGKDSMRDLLMQNYYCSKQSFS